MIDLLREQLLAPRYLGWLLDGWLTTLWVSLLVSAGATVLGVFIAAGRSSSRPALLRATGAYVSLFRNTPLLVQLFFWYFGAPAVLPEAVREWVYAGHVLSFELLSALVGPMWAKTSAPAFAACPPGRIWRLPRWASRARR